MVSKIIRICEKNKVSLSKKMNWKKGHDTKIVSYHSIFSPYNQESATFQKCRNSRQSGCLPRVIGHLPSSQVTFHRFFLGLEACPILPWPFQPPSQHFRQRHYHLNWYWCRQKLISWYFNATHFDTTDVLDNALSFIWTNVLISHGPSS